MLHLWRLRNGASSAAGSSASLLIVKQHYLSAAQAITRPAGLSITPTSSLLSPASSSCSFFSTTASAGGGGGAASTRRPPLSQKEKYKKIDQWRKTREKDESRRAAAAASRSNSSPSFNVRPDAARAAKKAEKAARREAYESRKAANTTAAGDAPDPWYAGETLEESGGVNAAAIAAASASGSPNKDVAASSTAGKHKRPIIPKRKFHEPQPSDSNHPSSQFFMPFKDQVLPGQASVDDTSLASSHNSHHLATSFNELRVPPHVVGKLNSGLGITYPTPIQNASIPFLMNSPFFQLRNRGLGALPQNEPHHSQMTERDLAAQQRRRAASKLPTPRDMLIQDMTGCGKTLAYALPMLSLIDNFSRHTQGLVIAPTRELAVQIHRQLLNLNKPSKGGKNKKRRAHPIVIELAIGNVDRDYAESVRKHRPHIIVATPQAAQALVMPPATNASSPFSLPSSTSSTSSRLQSFGTISLAHLRMLVLDEVDHLLLPFSAPGMERFLQFYTSSRTHGSFHRMGRIVAVSAAISQRVFHLGKKWLNRPVTATPRGVFNGWVKSEHMLRDKFYLRREETASVPVAATQQQSEETSAVDEDEDLDDDQASDQVPLSDDINPVEIEKVSQFVIDKELSEPFEMVEEDDDVTYGESDDDETSEAEETRRFLRQAEEVQRDEDGNVLESLIVRADEFKLPGVGAAPVAVSLHATFEPEAKVDEVASVTTFEEPAINEALINSLDIAPPLPADEQTLRFLPPTMKHFVVHVNPEVKISPYRLTKPEPLAAAKKHPSNSKDAAAAAEEVEEPTAEELASEAKEAKKKAESDREYHQAVHSKATLLSQLHSVLKPRVALVFFNRASEAEEVARELRKSKGMKSALLLGGTAYDAEVRISALEAALKGSVPFIFATDLASRGLDIKGLSHVINFDPPKTALDYIHRAGRVERLGGKVGCSVVTVIKDARVAPKPVKGKPETRPSLYIGPQVLHMQKLVAQLHLKSVAQEVELKRGEFAAFVPPTAQSTAKVQSESTSSESTASTTA